MTTTTTKKTPVHSISAAKDMWWMPLFAVAQKPQTLVSCQPPWPSIQMAWVYLARGPGQVGPVWAPLHHPSHRYPPLTGSLSQPWDSSALRVLAGCSRVTGKPGTDRVKAVILENWVRRGKMCTRFVSEWERFRVSCPHHGTHEGSSPVTASSINMSSQSYKHMLGENS